MGCRSSGEPQFLDEVKLLVSIGTFNSYELPRIDYSASGQSKHDENRDQISQRGLSRSEPRRTNHVFPIQSLRVSPASTSHYALFTRANSSHSGNFVHRMQSAQIL